MQNEITTLTESARKRYQRHLSLPEIGLSGQLNLANASVLCIGAGGLGAPVLSYLTAAGIGHIGIVDHDVIELSNLQRQIFFTDQDCGKLKVEVLAERLKLLNSEVIFTTYPYRFSLDNATTLLANYALVVDCSDNFATRYLINDACYALNKPFVCASVERFSGQVSFFSGINGPCYRCLYPYPNPEIIRQPNCAEAGVLGVVCGLVGSAQATEAIKYFTKIGELLSGELLIINSLTMHTEKFRLTQQPTCPVCVQHLPLQVLERPTQPLTCQQEVISADELKISLTKQIPMNLLDVREPHEHAHFNIGGVLMPLSELEKAQPLSTLEQLDKNLLTVIYCQSGIRSQKALALLRANHFKHLKVLTGGVNAW